MNPLLMSILLIVGLGIFGRTMYFKIQLLLALGPVDLSGRINNIVERLKNLVILAIGQKRLVGRKREWLAGIMHAFIFWGFCVLLIRSISLYGEGFVKGFQLPIFGHDGLIGYLYIALKDVMEGMVLLMALYAIFRRAVLKPSRMHNTWEAYFV
ncbi:MAG: (Fe-S)-binding protein, partial [Desulfobacteraceae bacterium]|nr:(Fe-S)-binding protein [Desulfobacteraceae bacterium]